MLSKNCLEMFKIELSWVKEQLYKAVSWLEGNKHVYDYPSSNTIIINTEQLKYHFTII